MRIGIDARFLTHPQRGGFKSYTRTVVASLAEADTGNEYFLYTDRESDELDPLPGNFLVEPVTSPNAVLREQIALPAQMRKDRLDIAHFLCNTSPCYRAPRMVVTLHDAIALRDTSKRTGTLDLHHRFLNQYWRSMIPRGVSIAQLIVADSVFARDDIADALSVPADRFRIVHIAIDPRFNPNALGSRHADIPENTLYFLAFAASDGRKNHGKAIEAFLSIADDCPNVKLVLICSHPDVRSQLKVDHSSIMPVGPVSNEELVWLYRNALALVFPSLDEGFGLPPAEAMACGTPVVASNAGSLPEVLGEAALLVNPLDAQSIASGMRRIIDDEVLRRELAAKGLHRAAAFSRRTMGEKLIQIYAEAANIR